MELPVSKPLFSFHCTSWLLLPVSFCYLPRFILALATIIFSDSKLNYLLLSLLLLYLFSLGRVQIPAGGSLFLSDPEILLWLLMLTVELHPSPLTGALTGFCLYFSVSSLSLVWTLDPSLSLVFFLLICPIFLMVLPIHLTSLTDKGSLPLLTGRLSFLHLFSECQCQTLYLGIGSSKMLKHGWRDWRIRSSLQFNM